MGRAYGALGWAAACWVGLAGCGGLGFDPAGGGGTEGGTETESGSAATSDTLDPSATSSDPTNDTQGQTTTDTTTGTPTTGDPSTTTSGDTDSTDTDSGGSMGCCEAHGTPGCNEPDVQTCVCETMANCCVFEWDVACVNEAMNACDATCMGVGETGGSTGDTGGTPADCDRVHQIELSAEDAVLSGGWTLQESQLGEGMIAVLDNDPSGSVLWTVDVPCQDTWHIWVRYWEQGNDDSYYVTLDGEPQPAAIFEGDCTQAGDGYDWRELNWRDEGAPNCEYLEDPWAPDWAAGAHEIELSYRESIAVARIVVTNDAAYQP